jgi:hypothetical protein
MAAADFNATTTDRPLWANAEGHPTIWMRWMPWHEEMVESEQPMTYPRLGTVGRIVKCGSYGTWFVGDWRPMCATCTGTRVVLVVADEVLPGTLDAGLCYLRANLVECPDCRPHPGWVVG